LEGKGGGEEKERFTLRGSRDRVCSNESAANRKTCMNDIRYPSENKSGNEGKATPGWRGPRSRIMYNRRFDDERTVGKKILRLKETEGEGGNGTGEDKRRSG